MRISADVLDVEFDVPRAPEVPERQETAEERQARIDRVLFASTD